MNTVSQAVTLEHGNETNYEHSLIPRLSHKNMGMRPIMNTVSQVVTQERGNETDYEHSLIPRLSHKNVGMNCECALASFLKIAFKSPYS